MTGNLLRRLSAAAAALVAMSSASAVARADDIAPADFVALADVDPSILQEIRYATAHNFVGDPVAGYRSPICILVRPAAEGLRRAQQVFLDRRYIRGWTSRRCSMTGTSRIGLVTAAAAP